MRCQARGPAGAVRAARAARRAGARPGDRGHVPVRPGRRDRGSRGLARPGGTAVPERAPGRLRRLRLAARVAARPARAQGGRHRPAAAPGGRPRARRRDHGRGAAGDEAGAIRPPPLRPPSQARPGSAGAPGSSSRSARTAWPGSARTARTRSSTSGTARSRTPPSAILACLTTPGRARARSRPPPAARNPPRAPGPRRHPHQGGPRAARPPGPRFGSRPRGRRAMNGGETPGSVRKTRRLNFSRRTPWTRSKRSRC